MTRQTREYWRPAAAGRSISSREGKKAMAEVLLTADAARSLVDSVDAFLFDCDGVIWKGDELIEGVPETLELLRKMGKKIVFVTNNSRKSRKQYSKKFKALGLDVTEEEIFTSSFAAAMFLKLNNFSPEKKVYVVGEDGILEELKLAGFECFGGPEDGKKNIMLEANFYFDHDKSVGAVIVGLDQYFNYYKMQYASLCIRENPGCLFIATNRDPTGHMTPAQEWPGAGTMVAAVSCSVQKEPIVVGKPSSFLMDFLLKRPTSLLRGTPN
uniref:Uncharacterized protein n=3 Tax=Avena sativa TaxID=4498 RepID=A0ACD5YJC0_AVESA